MTSREHRAKDGTGEGLKDFTKKAEAPVAQVTGVEFLDKSGLSAEMLQKLDTALNAIDLSADVVDTILSDASSENKAELQAMLGDLRFAVDDQAKKAKLKGIAVYINSL